jgi:predicted nucleic acid-binding protein
MVVAAALAGRADFLVTLGRHLLDLAGLPGVLVVRPSDFLRELRAQH